MFFVQLKDNENKFSDQGCLKYMMSVFLFYHIFLLYHLVLVQTFSQIICLPCQNVTLGMFLCSMASSPWNRSNFKTF